MLGMERQTTKCHGTGEQPRSSLVKNDLVENGVERDRFLFLNANPNSNSHTTLSVFRLKLNRYQAIRGQNFLDNKGFSHMIHMHPGLSFEPLVARIKSQCVPVFCCRPCLWLQECNLSINCLLLLSINSLAMYQDLS
jgi:hypothetical protein